MDRPARKQVSAPAKATINVEQAGTYNIWYNRWTGEGRRHKPLERAERRCNMAKDMGYTKAQPGSAFCIHFARGCCMKGKDCTYWHRTPIETDREEQASDCFGRERFREDRDDMGGVGSFERDNRTLYVGNIKAPQSEMEEVVTRHFGEWGEIEHINILFHKNVAFVRYKRRGNAEFAREAMYGQSLDSNEILNVRWATEDPNPRVKEAKKRKVEDHIAQTIEHRLPQVGELGNVLDYEGYYQEAPPAKAQRLEQSGSYAALSDASNAIYGSGGAGGDSTSQGWVWDGIGWRWMGGQDYGQWQQTYEQGGQTTDPSAYNEQQYRDWYYAQGQSDAIAGAEQTADANTAEPQHTTQDTTVNGNGPDKEDAAAEKGEDGDSAAQGLSALTSAGYGSDEESGDQADGKE